MTLVKINENTFVDPSDVTALEKFEKWDCDPSPTGSSWLDHTGTIVTLKCGRKIYVRDIKPTEIETILKESK